MVDEHDELAALEPEMAAFVAAYEAETARDDAQVEAALAKVTAQIGAGAGATGAGLSLTVKVGIAGALIGVVGVIGLLSLESAPRPETPASVVAVAPEEEAQEVETPVEPESAIERATNELPQPVVPESEEPEAVPEEPESVPEEPAGPVPKKRPPQAPLPGEDDDDDSLMAELALLHRTRKALRNGRAEDALKAAAQHRREFPSGRLAEERDATEVSALCALDRGDEARRKAAAFERAHPNAYRDLLGDCE